MFSLLSIIFLRFVSLGYLISAMRRIKNIIQTDLTQMPNIRIMVAFIFAFALFALSSTGVLIGIVQQEIKKVPTKRANGVYITYSTCYLLSQSTLVVLFYKINSQSIEISDCYDSKSSLENS